jgi:outer membrane protein OmpA-like peptidoglycan-associated protein
MKPLRSNVLFLLLATVCVCSAQDATDTSQTAIRFGAFGHYNINIHTSDFAALPDVPGCCAPFDGGSGSGISLGGLLEYALSQRFSVGIRAGVSGQSARLDASEVTTVILGSDSLTGRFDRVIDASLVSIGVEPLLSIRIVGGITGYAGARLGVLVSNEYDGYDELVEPANIGTFETGSRIRNEASGTIPDASSLQLDLAVGLGVELPLNAAGNITLSPEAFYMHAVTPVSNAVSWSAHMFRIGAAVRYMPLPTVEPLPPPPPPPPPPPLALDVRATSVEAGDTETEGARIRIEEFISTNLRPLLNYVFFDEGSSELPERYNRLTSAQSAGFRVDQLHNVETMPTYYQLLNIIGRRLRDNPSATVTLVGTNSNTKGEAGAVELSRRRAETIHGYLRDVWAIAEERMKIEARNLPQTPSNNDISDGVEENRRVEIRASMPEITAPVITVDTLRLITTQAINFYPSMLTGDRLQQWQLMVQQNERQVKEYHGSDPLAEQLVWNVADEMQPEPLLADPPRFTLAASDESGSSFRTEPRIIPVDLVTIRHKREQQTGDKEIGRFGLILFDFNSAELGSANQYIAGIIHEYIQSNSTVSITGYTDRIGEADYNLKLSHERATATAHALDVDPAMATGVGEQNDLFNNDLPEGRFYSRTVIVNVETPVR